MTSQTMGTDSRPLRLGRSPAAVLAGFFACALLSLGTDQILHVLKVYPPWGEPMRDPGLNLLALTYRCVYAVAAGYITAKLAPRNPIHHVWVLGLMGLVRAGAGVMGKRAMAGGPQPQP